MKAKHKKAFDQWINYLLSINNKNYSDMNSKEKKKYNKLSYKLEVIQNKILKESN